MNASWQISTSRRVSCIVFSCTHICVYVCICVCVCVYIYMCVCVCVYVRICVYMHAHANWWYACTHIRTHTNMHACIHTRTHAWMCAHTHTHTRTHTTQVTPLQHPSVSTFTLICGDRVDIEPFCFSLDCLQHVACLFLCIIACPSELVLRDFFQQVCVRGDRGSDRPFGRIQLWGFAHGFACVCRTFSRN